MMIRVVPAAADSSILAGRMRRSLAGIVLIAALTACGGGGGDDDDPPPEPEPPVPVATTLSGTVATGAPLVGATVQVTDATGATVCEQQTIADGTYTCTLAPTAQRPLLVRAAKDETVLYSATVTSGDARANVTPLTHIIVSRLAPNGDAAALAGAIQLVTADALKAQADALLAALQPLLAALTQPSFDPLAGNLVANGTGQDKLLDTISVSVRPDGTGANIELTVKTIPVGSDPEPVSIQFRSNAASIPALPAEAVTAQTVAPVPAPSVVADLFARMTACYALPLSQRVNAPNDTAAVVGGPGDVIAPQCRSLFVNDDPATYLSGGNSVGRNAANEGSFSGLFRPGATGTVYQAYGVEYFRGNAEQDMVVSGYWQATNGQRANDVYVVRNVNGTLKLIGNQYVYPSAIRPFTEDREFLNTPQFSYYNTGYNVRVNNWTDGNGNPVFRKVLVTTPWNTQLTLLPAAGQALLAISQDGSTPTGTSILRLGAAYYNPGAVADPPWVKDPGAAVGTPMSEAELAALSNQGLWTFEFFFTDTSQPNVVQRNRTLSRPHTVAEIRQRQFANFTPAARANLIADSAATGTLVYTAPAVADIGTASGAAWTVPTNALEPTSVGVFGRAPFGSTTAGVSGNRYDDFASVASTARYTTVFCSSQSAADKHCDAGGQGRYAVGTSIYMLELWGLNDRQVEVSKKAALYKLQ